MSDERTMGGHCVEPTGDMLLIRLLKQDPRVTAGGLTLPGGKSVDGVGRGRVYGIGPLVTLDIELGAVVCLGRADLFPVLGKDGMQYMLTAQKGVVAIDRGSEQEAPADPVVIQ